MESRDNQVFNRVRRLLGKKPVSASEVSGGYSNVYRRVLHFADGSSCFVKVAVTPLTAAFFALGVGEGHPTPSCLMAATLPLLAVTSLSTRACR